ncbi:hypothetical protein [Vibrio jasicida]|uniref:hypothetical protein n=1 Tax=Vibrio jasicida TaxID=766224 RepID=UPI000A50ED2B|nr:hypothetical protein [Vibrio jasicida]
MKKTLFAAMAATLLLGSHSIAAKVTYEDAVASSAGFYENNNAVNKAPTMSGLGPDEQKELSSSFGIGKWANSSYTAAYNQSTIQISGTVLGADCTPIGVFGKLTKEECEHVGNGDFDCNTRAFYYHCQ